MLVDDLNFYSPGMNSGHYSPLPKAVGGGHLSPLSPGVYSGDLTPVSTGVSGGYLPCRYQVTAMDIYMSSLLPRLYGE